MRQDTSVLQQTYQTTQADYSLEVVGSAHSGEADGDLSFDQDSNRLIDTSSSMLGAANDGNVTQRSGQSTLSSTSSTVTFRDTFLEEEKAREIKNVQSITSIVNNPKKESMLRKVTRMVKKKVVGGGKPSFKPLRED